MSGNISIFFSRSSFNCAAAVFPFPFVFLHICMFNGFPVCENVYVYRPWNDACLKSISGSFNFTFVEGHQMALMTFLRHTKYMKTEKMLK